MPRSPHRFYHPGNLARLDSGSIILPPGESHHLFGVMRLVVGGEVIVFDGRGNAWLAAISGRRQGCAELTRIHVIDEGNGSASAGSVGLLLAVSVLKHGPMDWMIEKLSELGLATLQPLICSRTVVLPKESEGGVPERWERLALAAAKQCGRNRPLEFLPPVRLIDWLARERPLQFKAYAHFSGDARPIGEWIGRQEGSSEAPAPLATLCIGPEGGWTEEEAGALDAAMFEPVGLGPLTLRAETAAIAAAAAYRLRG